MKQLGMIAGVSLVLAAGALVVALMSGFGHRLQWWGYMTGFKILSGAVIAAGIGVVLSVVGAYLAWRVGQQTNLYLSAAALVVALTVVVPPLLWARTAQQLPYIHDITTDTTNPPAFVAILKERTSAPNPAEYGGQEIAQLQRQAYPDIAPLRVEHSPRQAFDAALATVRDMRWKIVASDITDGRIEASDQTLWYGFIDDVVIRVTPVAGGARVDVRSVSRVGKSDIGTNARRIRAFLRGVGRRLREQAVDA